MQFRNNTFRPAQTNLIGLLKLQVNTSASELKQDDCNAQLFMVRYAVFRRLSGPIQFPKAKQFEFIGVGKKPGSFFGILIRRIRVFRVTQGIPLLVEKHPIPCFKPWQDRMIECVGSPDKFAQ